MFNERTDDDVTPMVLTADDYTSVSFTTDDDYPLDDGVRFTAPVPGLYAVTYVISRASDADEPSEVGGSPCERSS